MATIPLVRIPFYVFPRSHLQSGFSRAQSGSVGLSRARYSLFNLGNPAPSSVLYWLTTLALISPPASTVGPKQEQMVQTCGTRIALGIAET